MLPSNVGYPTARPQCHILYDVALGCPDDRCEPNRMHNRCSLCSYPSVNAPRLASTQAICHGSEKNWDVLETVVENWTWEVLKTLGKAPV